MLGTLPRLYESKYNLSRFIGINEKLSQLHKEANIGYIDPWLDLKEKRMITRETGYTTILNELNYWQHNLQADKPPEEKPDDFLFLNRKRYCR